MGPCLGDHLCWASKLLGLITLLSGCGTPPKRCEAHGSGTKDPSTHTLLNGIRGGSVLFQMTSRSGVDLEPELEKISWRFGPESDYTILLELEIGADASPWINPQDKYKLRVCAPNAMSLMIQNLSTQDSGQYTAQARLKGGRGRQQVFHLDVYEPVPPAKIRPKSLSVTPDWCNATLECGPPEEEKLTVTWGSEGLPRELEQRVTPGPSPNPWTLAVRLSPSPLNASLTCVVSNPVDQKNATLDLGDICGKARETDSHGWHTASFRRYMLGIPLALLFILGAGLSLWMIRQKKKKEEVEKEMMNTGTGWQEDHREEEDGVHYAELMEVKSLGDKLKWTDEQQWKERGPLGDLYSELQPHPKQ